MISATKDLTFGTWYFTETQKSEFLIVTIEYTYNGEGTAEFSPESVVIVFPEGSTYPGFAMAATNYQAEGSNIVANFMNDGPVLTYVKHNQTRRDKFGWGISTVGDTQYQLLFPDTAPIEIRADD